MSDRGVRPVDNFVKFIYGVSQNRYQIFTLALENVTYPTKILPKHATKSPKMSYPRAMV